MLTSTTSSAPAHLLHLPTIFSFNQTATTQIYTLSLHDALPISSRRYSKQASSPGRSALRPEALSKKHLMQPAAVSLSCCRDRKSTRLNSSHSSISYAVFCLKKKKYIGWTRSYRDD